MYFVGLDLGQRVDFSALVVVERIERRLAFQQSQFAGLVVRYAERMPLGTPYPRVVARVREIVRCDELLGKCSLSVDATGVGAPVVDMLSAAQLGCELNAVVMTGGQAATGGSVPKRDLLAEVQVLLDAGELRIGKIREAARLMRELADVRMSLSKSGRMALGAEGTGQHDDLVIALALACWRAKRRRVIGEVGRRLI